MMIKSLITAITQPQATIQGTVKATRHQPKRVDFKYSNYDAYIFYMSALKTTISLTAWLLSAYFTYLFALAVLVYQVFAVIATIVLDGGKLATMYVSGKNRGNKALLAASLCIIGISCAMTVSYFVVDLRGTQDVEATYTQQVSDWQLKVDSIDARVKAATADVASAETALSTLSASGSGKADIQARIDRLTEIVNNNSNVMARGTKQERAVYQEQNNTLNQQIEALTRQLDAPASTEYVTAQALLADSRKALAAAQQDKTNVVATKPVKAADVEGNKTSALARTLADVSGISVTLVNLTLATLIALLLECVLYGVNALMEAEIARARYERLVFDYIGPKQARKDGCYTIYPRYSADGALYWTHVQKEVEPEQLPTDASTPVLAVVTTPAPGADIDATSAPAIFAGTILDVMRRKPASGLYTYSDMRHLLDANKPLAVPIGWDADGNKVVASISDMHHILIAGATGSGKTEFAKGVVAALCENGGRDVQLTLIDPKMVDFAQFQRASVLREGKVITDMQEAISIIDAAVEDMADRYRALLSAGAVNITDYNSTATEKMIYRVILVEEFADLLDEAEGVSKENRRKLMLSLQRLAQKARACGIHLILSTQRPDANVVEGRLKANLPSTVCFRVRGIVNSQVVLGQKGAENLDGKGDMIFVDASGTVRRLQALMLTKQDISDCVSTDVNVTHTVNSQKSPNTSAIGFKYAGTGLALGGNRGAARREQGSSTRGTDSYHGHAVISKTKILGNTLGSKGEQLVSNKGTIVVPDGTGLPVSGNSLLTVTGTEGIAQETGNSSEINVNRNGNSREQQGTIVGNTLGSKREQGNSEEWTAGEQLSGNKGTEGTTLEAVDRGEQSVGTRSAVGGNSLAAIKEQGTEGTTGVETPSNMPQNGISGAEGTREQGTGNSVSISSLTPEQLFAELEKIERVHGTLTRKVVSMYITGKTANISKAIAQYKEVNK